MSARALVVVFFTLEHYVTFYMHSRPTFYPTFVAVHFTRRFTLRGSSNVSYSPTRVLRQIFQRFHVFLSSSQSMQVLLSRVSARCQRWHLELGRLAKVAIRQRAPPGGENGCLVCNGGLRGSTLQPAKSSWFGGETPRSARSPLPDTRPKRWLDSHDGRLGTKVFRRYETCSNRIGPVTLRPIRKRTGGR